MWVKSRDQTQIEVIVQYQGSKQTEAPAIIIGHPYGPLGGNKNNNVVCALQKHFLDSGYITVCFDFRGSGRSKGRTSWTGMPERDDYQAVMDFLFQQENLKQLQMPQVNRLVICGYSFGGMIAKSMQCTQVPHVYVLISFCLGVTWALATVRSSFFKARMPEGSKALCVFGSLDQFTGTSRYETWCKGQDLVQCVRVPEVDHFWFGSEHILIKKINDWLTF